MPRLLPSRSHSRAGALLVSGLVAVCLAATLFAAPSQAGSSSGDQAQAAARAGLLLHFNAWGDLKLGMTQKEAFRTDMVSRKADHCAPGYQMKKRYRDRGWVVWRGDFPKMKVSKIVITSPREHTKRGIHVGSTLHQLKQAYAGLSKVHHSSFSARGAGSPDLYFAHVRRPWGVLNFQFDYGKRPGPRSPIDLIQISRHAEVYWGC